MSMKRSEVGLPGVQEIGGRGRESIVGCLNGRPDGLWVEPGEYGWVVE